MRLVFRVDSAQHIGNGHLMRCLTLADTAAEHGAKTLFLCRDWPSSMSKIVTDHGHQLRTLPGHPTLEYVRNQPQTWLGWTQEHDAQATLKALEGEAFFDALVVDSYAIDSQWHQQMRTQCKRLVVIDDLANRTYHCDLLIDQTYGRSSKDYLPWVHPQCQLLLGTGYALLRQQFAEVRTQALSRRQPEKIGHRILVSIGGVDADNLSGRLLHWLERLTSSLHIDIVLAANAPHIESIQQQARQSHHRVNLRINVTEMAELMSSADIAIGAAGSSSWERCCLGLPTILLITADNQQLVAQNLEAANAVINLGKAEGCSPTELLGAVELLLQDNSRYTTLVNHAQQVCDGLGAYRVVQAIENSLKS